MVKIKKATSIVGIFLFLILVLPVVFLKTGIGKVFKSFNAFNGSLPGEAHADVPSGGDCDGDCGCDHDSGGY